MSILVYKRRKAQRIKKEVIPFSDTPYSDVENGKRIKGIQSKISFLILIYSMMSRNYILHDYFLCKGPNNVDVEQTEPNIPSEMPSNIEEIATDVPPEIKESEESEVMDSGEIIHGVNCICKLYMGTCIRNTIIVNDGSDEKNENETENKSV